MVKCVVPQNWVPPPSPSDTVSAHSCVVVNYSHGPGVSDDSAIVLSRRWLEKKFEEDDL